MRELHRAVRIGRKFQNPVTTVLMDWKKMLRLYPAYLASREETEPRERPGPFVTDTAVYDQAPVSGLRETWFGHSSLLLEVDGVTLLLDPVWEKRASPVNWFGPKRFFAPTMPLEKLPALDAVVISHDHFDHLGEATVRQLAAQRPTLRWITGLEVGPILARMGVAAERITELDWTESTVISHAVTGEQVQLTSLPARHFSGRSFRNRFETLWSSFTVQGSRHRIYHGADSGYWDGYKAIGALYGPFDLTLLEIGAFDVRWKELHLGPDGAAQAFFDLGGKGLLMPVHWGLFNLGLHGWRQPIERMRAVAAEQGIALLSPEPGRPTEVVAEQPVFSDWWKRRG